MRWLCFLFSMIMHTVVLSSVVYFSALQLKQTFCCPPAYEVTLVKQLPDEPAPETTLAGLDDPAPETKPVTATQSADPAPKVKAVPPKLSAPEQSPPVFTDSTPSASPAHVSTVSPPTQVPEVEQMISPRSGEPESKKDNEEQVPTEKRYTRPEELPTTAETEKGIRVAGLHGFAAFADTFSLERAGADVFVAEEYWGHYRIGPGRFASVMGGGDPGKEDFLFYDSKTGLYRKLYRQAEMIFRYGPSFDEHEPPIGSVTILPKKDRYQNEYIRKPAQLIWLPEDPPMQYGTRLDLVMRELRLNESGDKAVLVLAELEGSPRPGIVLVLRDNGAKVEDSLGMAQAFSLRGWGILVLDVPENVTAETVNTALELLKAQPEVDASRCGVWGHGDGVSPVLDTVSHGMGAGFAVFSAFGEIDLSHLAAQVLVPSLWVVGGNGAEAQRQAVQRVASKRGRDCTALVDVVDTPIPLPEGLRYGALVQGWLTEH